jgi:glycosyltransferase involved in cell wall biosynthesis
MNFVSVVVTLRNERESIAEFLSGLLNQSRSPDEIILVDGGSTDGTAEWLDEASAKHSIVRVYHAPRTTIAQGRNIAISRAKGSLIAVTDAGTWAPGDWLLKLIAPLEIDPHLGVSAGFYRAGGVTLFERCLSTVITPQLSEIEPLSFLPSSRSVAFRKTLWERAGGYPEWLRHCEDIVFDLELRRHGARMAFVPDAVVTWRARPTLRAFARQYFDYARGDGHAKLWPRRHLIRYSAYAVGAGLLVMATAVPAYSVVLAMAAGLHLAKFYRRVLRQAATLGVRRMLPALLLVPLIVVTGDLAKMAGYPVGRFERWRLGGESGLLRRLRPNSPGTSTAFELPPSASAS